MATNATPRKLTPFLLLFVVTMIALVYGMSQCNSNDQEFAMIAEEEAKARYEARRDSLEAIRLDSIERVNREAALLRARTTPPIGDSVLYNRPAEKVVVRQTTLYSTIDGLNVRSGPSLKNGIVARLPLYAEVIFLNEVTDSLYEIDLGEITPRAPWVRVQLQDGKTGWVYGAGVNYYKYRLQGVIN